MVGRNLGHYRILEKLGEGGMGEVYLAEDKKLRRQIALKILPPSMASSQERLDRFQREAQALAALDHPNIVHIYSVEHHEDVHFLTMQLIRGRRLSDMIPDGGMTLSHFFDIAISLTGALRAAHEKGVIHRDLKPSNVMVDDEGRVKILDFGLAKLKLPQTGPGASELPTEAMTQEGLALGTVPYMSPEQARGEPVDHRSDVFSLGILFYEMVVGTRPFQGGNPASVISSILRDAPAGVAEVNPNLPHRLSRILHRCLEKNTKDRYQSVQVLSRDLQDLRLEVESGQAAGSAISTSVAAGRWSRVWQIALAAALVMVMTLVGISMWRSRELPPASDSSLLTSLAVLPLENLIGDPEQQYLVDGMTDALINDLSKIGSLTVISRTTAMRYKSSDKTLPEIARELNVDGIVEGSVMRELEGIRIRIQLIDAVTDSPIWSDSFERELEGILALQSEVAQAIARAIQVTLTPEEEARLSRDRPVRPETYQAYLRGMFWLNKQTPEGIKKGMAFFLEAVEKDPGDPLAYAGLALGYITVAHGPEPPDDALSRAKSAALKAVRLDDTLAEAHAALAFLQGYYEWDWDLAQRTLDHALEINPSLAIAHYHDSWFHYLFGRDEEAIAAHKRAQELDPLKPQHTAYMGGLYRLLGRHEEALIEVNKAIAMAPDHPLGHSILARIYIDQGQYEEAIAATQRAVELAPKRRWTLGLAYAAAGRTEDAREILSELKEQPVTGWNALCLARLHMALGDVDETFLWLSYERPHAFVPWLRVMPELAPLREDPRFLALLEKMKLPPIES